MASPPVTGPVLPEGDLEWEDGVPRSRRFADRYFSAQDGLAESRAVFLQGCGLPEAWRGRGRFVVGELGFGTGLNILALLQLWRRERAPDARLHIFSIEAHPLPVADARRALKVWPELGDEAAALLALWPPARQGLHRLDFPAWSAVLDLAVLDVEAALQGWDGRADAWFLDGFAPSRNPQMWSPRVLGLVAARSAAGARAATFTVAGSVRRGLQSAGFQVAKAPGHGRKKERLEARLPGPAAAPGAAPARVAVVGGGVAGASLVRALRALGVEPLLVEPAGLGAGASGNPAALVTPRLDAGLGPVARLYAQAFARAVDLYPREAPGAVIAHGALQLAVRPRDAGRFAQVSAWDGFAPGAMAMVEPGVTRDALGEPDAPAALSIGDALVVEPAPLLQAWGGVRRVSAQVGRLERAEEGWRLIDPDGTLIAVADAVCLACGVEAPRLAGLHPLRPVRGQVDWAPCGPAGVATAWGGYAIPTRDGVLFGASHVRDETDTSVRRSETEENLGRLAVGRPALAARVRAGSERLGARAGVRAATADHLPLAGRIAGADGMFMLAGLGGRGFTLAPLLAEHVAALVTGHASPLPEEAAALVAPDRFGRCV